MGLGEGSRKQPWWAAGEQPWANSLLEASHTEALWAFGEYNLFVLMWKPIDYDRGLVALCSVCAVSAAALAFEQPERKKCPSCFGSRFEGGFRAQVIRPSIWSDINDDSVETIRGAVVLDRLQGETTSDFSISAGDYVFRADGSRWQTDDGPEGVARTGFGLPLDMDSMRGSFSAALEDPTAVAYSIPVPHGAPDLPTLLERRNFHIPADIDALDIVASPDGYIL